MSLPACQIRRPSELELNARHHSVRTTPRPALELSASMRAVDGHGALADVAIRRTEVAAAT